MNRMKSLYPVHPVIPSKKDKETEMEHEAVTETIIGCAYRVYNTMGFGLRPKCLRPTLKTRNYSRVFKD